jgi:hypothetical protein
VPHTIKEASEEELVFSSHDTQNNDLAGLVGARQKEFESPLVVKTHEPASNKLSDKNKSSFSNLNKLNKSRGINKQAESFNQPNPMAKFVQGFMAPANKNGEEEKLQDYEAATPKVGGKKNILYKRGNSVISVSNFNDDSPKE